MKSTNAMVVALLLCVGVVSSESVGQHHSHGERKSPPGGSTPDKIIINSRPPTPGRVELPLKSFEIPDSWLVDQNGKRVKFYSDLVKGKVVVINFFFTKCNDVCPMQGRAIARLVNRLGDRLGRDVFFVSVSKDPKNDTVERLHKWAKDYDVRSGWTLVSGDEEVIRKLLLDFNGEQMGQGMHESVLLIGNDKTGVWTSSDGLLFPEEIVKVIDDVSGSR